MIPKNFYCAGAMYSDNSWTNYWEGTFKRDNLNIGKLTTDSYTFIGNYGITNKLDVLFNVPYVTTNASAGTLKGQQGVQDLTVSVKWLAFKQQLGKGSLTFIRHCYRLCSIDQLRTGFLPAVHWHAQTQRPGSAVCSTTSLGIFFCHPVRGNIFSAAILPSTKIHTTQPN